jgi:hypothetical protein
MFLPARTPLLRFFSSKHRPLKTFSAVSNPMLPTRKAAHRYQPLGAGPGDISDVLVNSQPEWRQSELSWTARLLIYIGLGVIAGLTLITAILAQMLARHDRYCNHHPAAPDIDQHSHHAQADRLLSPHMIIPDSNVDQECVAGRADLCSDARSSFD